MNIKKMIVFGFVMMLVVSAVGFSIGVTFEEGSNDLLGDVIEIHTWEDLNNIRNDLAGDYRLMNDLNETSAGYMDHNDPATPGWLPIGNDDEPFTGSFDGQGHTITGLYIDRGDTDYVGLFGYLNEQAAVFDVMLEDVDVTGDGMVGALAGENYGEINDSSANGTVSGDNRVGGLVGRNRGTVDTSFAFVTVDGDHTYIGGLVGTNSQVSIVSNSYAMGDVTGHRYVGGLNGGNWGADSIISNSYATGNVSGDEDIGGLLGGSNDGWVLNCYAKGEVSGDLRVGGLVGHSGGTSILNNIVQNSYATGDVTGNSRIGGLVGRNDRTVENSYATGSVSVTGWNVGGLVGWNTRMVNNSYATGDVNGANRVGGIVGWNDGSGTVHNSYATGYVSGTQDDVGGLVGEHTGWGTVENSFWDTETGGPDNGIGEGKTTAEMRELSTFMDAGWDIEIHETEDPTDGYPFLSTQVGGGSPTWYIHGTLPTTEITDWYELHAIRYNLTGEYVIMNDLTPETPGYDDHNDPGTLGWLPIGDDDEPFTGSFDGQGNTISGLYIDRGDTDHVGLFGYLNEQAAVFDVMLEDVDVTGDGMVGALAGENYGEINDSSATGTVSGDNRVGGLVGRNRGTVDSSFAFVTVDGDGSFIGGLVGTNSQVSIVSNSYAMGDVNGNQNVGGLNGGNWGEDSTISNSYATGTVSGTDRNVGGLLGGNNEGLVSNSYAKGEASGYQEVGGLVGLNSDGTVSNSYATGDVSGTFARVGGLVGYNYRGTLSHSYATGTVSETDFVGGLVGHNWESTVENSFWDIETGGPDNGVGQGETTAEMMTQSTFTDAGWDFSENWWMEDGETRPFLRMEWSTDIRNSHQLQMMAMDLTEDYTLIQDIDLTGYITDASRMWGTSPTEGAGWLPIGTGPWYEPENHFNGILEGKNYTISGLHINRPTDRVGLFGFVGTEGTVKNLEIENYNIIGTDLVGGLVGENRGTVSNSSAMGTMSGGSTVGGLVGYNYEGMVSNSYANVDVSGTGIYVGGLVGENRGTVENSYAMGTVSGAFNVGGLVGFSSSEGTVSSSSADGTVSGGSHNTGGLVGTNRGSVENSFATGDVEGDGYVGGLVGFNWDGTVSYSNATGTVTGVEWLGGLVGENDGHVLNSHASGDTTGSWERVGGLVGSNIGNVSYSSSMGHTDGDMHVGGLVGYNIGHVTNSYAVGDTTGWGRVGGLVGSSEETISRSYATGNVSGSQYIGGFIGENSGIVSNSYAAGGVSGSNIGGFAGRNFDGTVENSFYDSDTTGQSDTGKGTPKTTVEMKTQTTFTDAGWDFDEIWHMVEGYTYPLLQWQPLPDVDFFSIDLTVTTDNDGWNFVSFNLLPADTSLDFLLAGIDGSYEHLMWYDASHSEWQSYDPGRPDHFNTLHTWDHTMGIWLKVTEDVTLSLVGDIPEDTDITLYPGWNMVGSPSASEGNHELPSEITRVGYFDPTDEYNLAYDHEPWDFMFAPGQGYWLYSESEEPVVWTVEY